MSGDELKTIVEGLESNLLLDYDYLLTGYIGKRWISDHLMDSQDLNPFSPVF